MNVKEYISSGILEQYVSGLISPQEKQEVECMSHIYPEIQTELNTLYEAFEALARDMQRTPPAHLKASVMSALSELKTSEEKPKLQAPTLDETVNEIKQTGNRPTDNIRQMNTAWIRIAASILLLICLALAYLLNDKSKNASRLQDELTIQRENNIKNENALAALSKQVDVISNENYQKINLAGIPEKSPSSAVAVYWNKQTSEVFVGNINLPEAPLDKQYQLWAIADGKPVDIGMINSETRMDSLFQQMKNITNPQAFAITLEKKGGVPSPTMSEMYVLGKI